MAAGDLLHLLEAVFPGEAARYFRPMTIGSTAADADHGAALILDGIKTLTSSPFRDYPDGRLPFAGALSVLLDGSGRPRAIVETTKVEILPFRAVTEEMARAYGEGDGTVAWWLREMGAWYRSSAARHGAAFDESTPIIWEWFAVARQL